MVLALKTTCVESLALAPHIPLHWTDVTLCQAWPWALDSMCCGLRVSCAMKCSEDST